MQTAMLLVAHGSRRARSNEEIRELTRALASRTQQTFDQVACAFLELAEPDIGNGIARLADAGARHITVLPYFLSDGRHVHDDIPAQVDAQRPNLPHVTIDIAPYIGASARMPELLLQQARQHGRDDA